MNNPPAFPSSNEVTLNDWVSSGHSGMTLRDYMAARAMQAQISLPETLFAISKKTITADQVCGSCYEWADAMLKAREG
jgi:hypothetical protein